jgi:hypothetical protein
LPDGGAGEKTSVDSALAGPPQIAVTPQFAPQGIGRQTIIKIE